MLSQQQPLQTLGTPPHSDAFTAAALANTGHTSHCDAFHQQQPLQTLGVPHTDTVMLSQHQPLQTLSSSIPVMAQVVLFFWQSLSSADALWQPTGFKLSFKCAFAEGLFKWAFSNGLSSIPGDRWEAVYSFLKLLHHSIIQITRGLSSLPSLQRVFVLKQLPLLPVVLVH